MFYLPTKVFWGIQDESAFIHYCSNRRICIISSSSGNRLKNPIIKEIIDRMSQSSTICIALEVKSNPDYNCVKNSVDIIVNNNCDLLVAIGGGSVIDCAKASAYAVIHGLDCLWQAMINPDLAFSSALPLLVINTSSGTGSEINNCAVITHKEEKRALVCDAIYPKATWIIPSLQLSMTYEQTIPMFLDCMFHAIEGYLSKNTSFFGRQSAKDCLSICLSLINIFQKEYSTDLFRENFALASLYSALADTYGGCLSIHSLGHAISAKRPMVSHGFSIAVLSRAYYTMLHMVGDSSYHESEKSLLNFIGLYYKPFSTLCDFIKNILDICALEHLSLSIWGITEKQCAQLYINARKTVSVLFENDPVILTDGDYIRILKESI